jgi:uncharacterized protein YlxW (UPF0749 family)
VEVESAGSSDRKVESYVKQSKWALGFVMLVFGLLITTQFRVTKQNGSDLDRGRTSDPARELKATQEKLKAAEKERDRLAAEIAQIRSPAGQSSTFIPTARLSSLELLAGTTEIQGPGLIVTVTEAKDAQKAKVADEDLWRVLNELLAAGAEGLAVGGERITVISGIRTVGQRIMVYQTAISTPVEIAAIGDPAVMEAALRMRSGVVETLDRWGVKVTLSRSDKIILPPFRTIPNFRFAKPTNK